MNRTLPLLTLTAIGLIVFINSCGDGGSSAPARDAGTAAVPSATEEGVPSGEGRTDGEVNSDGSPFDVATPQPPAAPEDETASDPEPPMDTAADDGPAQQRPAGEGSDTSAIAGFWDYARDSDAGTDVVLFAISPDGVLTEYDYRADAVGDGEDCHAASTASIASRGDDRYDIQNGSSLPGSSSVDDVLIVVEGVEIVFRYIGDAFDPAFGEGQAGVTERYPAVTGRTPEQLTLCKG